MKDKLAIFDMDGTLFDTSKTNYYSYLEAAKKYGVELPFNFNEYVTNLKGKTYKEMFKGIDEDTLENIHIEKKKLYKKYIHYTKVNSELFDKIQDIKNECFIALATSANRDNVEDILSYFNKREEFDLILSRENVENAKPSPEILLKAVDYFNVDRNKTVVYEDSVAGIEAANVSGMKVIEVNFFSRGKYEKI